MTDISKEKIALSFTVDQVNAILNVLGNAPFVASANLINEIQTQGGPQVAELQAKCPPQAEATAETPAA
jgi:hypothetical protein